ncbi:MAG TPA: MBL fold metallo-hydrolase [Methanoregulaceae archaeon]|nr:MBL fold metallo-hydrolase [Methanoregulaceae archaeon]HQJ88131.1 MBL fold metallo-hydrolase [Methanoregulaceae archaeon]
MPIRWIPGRGFYANAFISGSVLVDAGVLPMAVEPYRDAIEVIVLTHGHHDHTAHVREIAHLCNARVAIHEADAPALIDETRSLSLQFGARPPGILPDLVLRDGDRVEGLRVLHTPGHTPGSCCLHDEETGDLFSGDTVFSDGCFGRYDFPGGSRESLARSLDRLADLGVRGLYPGHGFPVEEGGDRQIRAARELIRRL